MSSLTSATKIGTTMSRYWVLYLGVVGTATCNFLYLMDFDGRWEKRAKHNENFIKQCRESVKFAKHQREDLEAMLVEAREREAKANGRK